MKLTLNDGRIIEFEHYVRCSHSGSSPLCAAGNPVLKGCCRNVQRLYSFALSMKYHAGINIEVFYGGRYHIINEYHPDLESANKRILNLNEIYGTRNKHRML